MKTRLRNMRLALLQTKLVVDQAYEKGKEDGRKEVNALLEKIRNQSGNEEPTTSYGYTPVPDTLEAQQ